MKRAMVLVKAWCYFESHILSSQARPACAPVCVPVPVCVCVRARA